MKIGIQGELGAYSHIAVENLYKDADIKTCSTFEDTFKLAFNPATQTEFLDQGSAPWPDPIPLAPPRYRVLYLVCPT